MAPVDIPSQHSALQDVYVCVVYEPQIPAISAFTILLPSYSSLCLLLIAECAEYSIPTSSGQLPSLSVFMCLFIFLFVHLCICVFAFLCRVLNPDVDLANYHHRVSACPRPLSRCSALNYSPPPSIPRYATRALGGRCARVSLNNDNNNLPNWLHLYL